MASAHSVQATTTGQRPGWPGPAGVTVVVPRRAIGIATFHRRGSHASVASLRPGNVTAALLGTIRPLNGCQEAVRCFPPGMAAPYHQAASTRLAFLTSRLPAGPAAGAGDAPAGGPERSR